MPETRRASTNGQITIPYWIRDKYGEEYTFRDDGDRVILEPEE